MSLHPDIAAVLAGDSEGCIVTGDCRTIVPDLPDGCVDCVLADPPYGIPVGAAFVRRAGTVIENGSGAYNEGATWEWLASVAWMRPGANLAIFHRRGDSPPQTVRPWHKFYLVKDAPPPTPRPTFVSAVEECTIASTPGRRIWYGGGYVPNYWRGLTPNRLNQGHGHQAEKPEAAMAILVKVLSAPTHLILDPFCGTGTTCVAAKTLGRRWIGIELDPKYAEIARRRVASTPRPLFDSADPESSSSVAAEVGLFEEVTL